MRAVPFPALERRVRKRFSLGFGITPLVTEQVPEPENEENEWSTQYRKWDFALPVLVPVLEMGLPFLVLVNCAFGHLHNTSSYGPNPNTSVPATASLLKL
jgi:hypothetical protein